MQPVFKVNGEKFTYTSEQTSYYKGTKLKPVKPLSMGHFRISSIDSILSLAAQIKDTLVYRTNVHIMSGGIHYITVKADGIKLVFDLHNASDPVAGKIVRILNTYIRNEKDKLWLFEWEEK